MSKNAVEPERLQMAIWRSVACWKIKATRALAEARANGSTHTHTRKQVIFFAYTPQQWFRERDSQDRCT